MKSLKAIAASLVLIAFALPAISEPLNVGSKRFTESYILGEIITQTAKTADEAVVSHRQGLGNTAILLSAWNT